MEQEEQHEFMPWTAQLVASATKTDLCKYIDDRIDEYTTDKIAASSLHEIFIADFAGFTVAAFKKAGSQTKALRDLLRKHNINVSMARGSPIAEHLMRYIENKQWLPMPDDMLHEVDVQYRPIATNRAPIPARTSTSNTNNNNTFTNISRLYSDEQKYGGELSDAFDVKYRTFQTYCDMCLVPEEQKNKAFIFMLKGAALNYYHTLCKRDEPLPSLLMLCEDMKANFEGPEHQQYMLAKWNGLSLQGIIDQSENKDVEEALNKLITTLRSTQQGLNPLFHNDPFLHAKLLTACRGHPACFAACTMPSKNNNVAELTNNLKSNIATWKATKASQQQPQQYATEAVEDDQWFLERRYYGNSNNRNGNNYRPNNFRHDNYRKKDRPAYNNNYRRKVCFVCKKESCWSTRHTPEERQLAKKRLQGVISGRGQRFHTDLAFDTKFAAFLQDYEGDDPDDYDQHLADAFNNFLTFSDNDHDEGDQPQMFFTECGDMSDNVATYLTEQLANQSTQHALTATTPTAVELENINDTYLIKDRYNNSTFHGLLIDTGASTISTAGLQQYEAFVKIFGPTAVDTNQQTTIRFGIGTTLSKGTITIDTPIGSCHFHIVEANTPFLFCLKDMDDKGIYFNNLTNTLELSDGRSVPVVRSFGHAFLLWGQASNTISYLTETELRTLHRRFGHPSAQRLINLLDRSDHHDPRHRKILEEITDACNKCQKYGNAPLRYKFTLRDNTIDFNHSIIVDIMWIDGQPALHVADEATRFQAARFLPNMRPETVWDALRCCWIDCYLGPPDIINHDAGTNLTSAEFQQYTISLGITTKPIPVEAANSIGIIERYHKPLRRAFEVIKGEIGGNNKALILQMAVKTVNDTAGPDGIVPTLLVFGAYPRMTSNDLPAPNIVMRAKAINKAMAEVTKLRERRQIRDALRTRNGPTTDILPLGSDAWVWRVHRSQWEGPFKVLSTVGETVTLELPSGPTNFRSTSVKKYIAEKPTEPPEIIDSNEIVGDKAIPGDSAPNEAIENQRPQRNRRLPARFRDDNDEAEANLAVYFATPPGPDFKSSRQKELEGLIQRGVFRFVDRDTIPADARVFNSRFIDQIKLQGTPQAFEKSRLVIQAYNDQGKRDILTQSPTVQRASQRILLSVALIKNFDIYSRDISQAYTQSKSNLTRDIYARPPPELSLPDNMALKILLPLYGIPEAGTHWFRTYHSHHTNKLNLQQSASDPCLLHNKEAIVALQTDDTLFACTNSYVNKENAELVAAKFEAKDIEHLTIDKTLNFNGAKLTLSEQNGNRSIMVTQSSQCQKISSVAKGDRSQYIAQRARGAYISSVCHPQAAFDLSQAAQNTQPGSADYDKLNKRLQWQLENKETGLRFVKLNKDKLRIIVYTDGSFANNKDFSSQIGFVIVLADDDHCNLIQWSSNKCKRVTRSVLASELYAMVSGFDAACVIKHTIDAIMNKPIPLTICTDSRSLYECMVKLGTTKEKRLMIDIAAIRQSYERREISEIVWINGSSNPADAMTKDGDNNALKEMIGSNRVVVNKEGWVNREVINTIGSS